MNMKPGDIVTLTVARTSDLGAFLDAGTGRTSDDILLHKAQQVRQVKVGEKVEVYLYHDPKGRLTASMRLPQMREGQVARVNIINTTKDGAFVDIGAERGVFMPFAEMRGAVKCNEKVWVKLYRDKSNRLAVSMDVDEELNKAARPAENIKIGDMVTGSVYNFTEEGAFVFTQDRQIAFIHKDEITVRPKVGQEVTARVTYVREDGRLNVSMRPVKEEAMGIDAEAILALLNSRGGEMPYSDSTSPEVIKAKFNISKAAFKRALGSLLKENIIEQRDGWTYLRKP
ncbi:MAG: cvfB [Firmicutes bacterium]|nr:cvfB [Bacillota bacterium]